MSLHHSYSSLIPLQTLIVPTHSLPNSWPSHHSPKNKRPSDDISIYYFKNKINFDVFTLCLNIHKKLTPMLKVSMQSLKILSKKGIENVHIKG